MPPGYKNEIIPKKWVLENNTGFSNFIKKTFDYNFEFKDGQCNLFEHQRIIKDFIQNDSPYRGLIIYHGLGVGKTRSAIAAAETFGNEKKIVVMLPASIEQNFINEISKCGNSIYDISGKWVNNEKTWKRVIGESNFDDLDDTSQAEIRKKINKDVKNNYTFIHYNGITRNALVALGKNFFDNKIVIIDEVHNFISRISNNSTIAKSIYNMMMGATNCKILLLSGTPMINKPHEMAILNNIAKGYLYELVLHFTKGEITRDEISSQVKYIDFIDIDTIKKTINIIPAPYGFIKNEDGTFTKTDTPKTHEEIIKLVTNVLKQKKLQVKSHSINTSTILPEKDSEFDALFVSYGQAKVKNVNLLSRRITGLLSYFEYYDPAKYPKLNEIKEVTVTMSDEHFTKYMAMRQFEYEKEKQAQMHAKKEKNEDDDMKSNNMYRSFSRAICNFSFPNNIQRDYPSSFNAIQKEMDTTNEKLIVDNEDDEKNDKNTLYKKSIKNALDQLYDGRSEQLMGDGLQKNGPKYVRILQNVNKSPGHVLIYSQFRNVEGLKIMELVFRAHGYVEFDISKTKNGWKCEVSKNDMDKPKYIVFTSDKEKNKVLMDIYNSDFDLVPKEILQQMNVDDKERNLHGKIIKALMITQSGAEGISLKNVRQVHILEPYWNNVRIKQVIGRAVRANSHINLKKKEAVVDVFIYLTKFTEEQLKDSVVISREYSVTSDQYVYDISKRKGRIIESMLDVMKKTAVDCAFNQKSCFKLPTGFEEVVKQSHTYLNKDISHDIEDAQIVTKKVVTKVVNKKIQRTIKFLKTKSGIEYPYDVSTNEMFDPDEYKNKKFIVISKIEFIDGKPKIKRIEK